MQKKKSFILHCDYIKHIERLSDAEAGALFKAILIFADTGEITELPPMSEMAFSFISEQISRDLDKWHEICRKRSEAANKRWSNTAECNCINSIANNGDSVNETENKNVNVNEYVNESVNVNENVSDTDKETAEQYIPDRVEDVDVNDLEQVRLFLAREYELNKSE